VLPVPPEALILAMCSGALPDLHYFLLPKGLARNVSRSLFSCPLPVSNHPQSTFTFLPGRPASAPCHKRTSVAAPLGSGQSTPARSEIATLSHPCQSPGLDVLSMARKLQAWAGVRTAHGGTYAPVAYGTGCEEGTLGRRFPDLLCKGYGNVGPLLFLTRHYQKSDCTQSYIFFLCKSEKYYLGQDMRTLPTKAIGKPQTFADSPRRRATSTTQKCLPGF